jgi:peptidoglycan/LPS O-acetylase OafA/YrhL
MKKEIAALTGLRFLAAFLVFLFHVNIRTKLLFLPWPVYNVVQHGALGVTVFFVLSGFLLTYSHQKDFAGGQMQDGKYYLSFMYKRMARIYPAYLIGLLIFGLVCAAYNAWPAWQYLLSDLLMIQAAIPSVAMQWYGTGAWSVSVEIFFYLFFPLLLPLLLRLSQARQLAVLLGVVVAIGAGGGLAYNIWHPAINYVVMYSSPLFRCWEFIAGMIGGLLVFRFNWQVKEWQALAAVALAGAYIGAFGPKLNGYIVHNWLFVPAVVLLLAAVVDASQTKVLRVLAQPWMVYAGKISYCFYIAQLPLFAWQDFLIERKVPMPMWSSVLIFVVTLILSIILHHLVEVPAHKWLLARGAKSPYLALKRSPEPLAAS